MKAKKGSSQNRFEEEDDAGMANITLQSLGDEVINIPIETD